MVDSICGANATCGAIFESYGQDPLIYDDVRNLKAISYGIPNFDSFPQALVTVFQVLTLEGWSSMLYNYEDAGDAASSIVFFALVVIFGAFFSVNLFLASIMESFAKQQNLLEQAKEADLREAEKEERYRKERIRLGLEYESPRYENPPPP